MKLGRGVVLVHNLPHGFYEEQLEKYFSQFGEVTRLRVGRSEKTGGSKGYAFIEFKYPAVAEVAAQSLNNYLMFRHILKTVYIPPNKQTHNYFHQTVHHQTLRDGTKKLITPVLQRAEEHVDKINDPVTDEQHAYRVHHSKMKLTAMEKRLAAAGINIDLSGVLYDPEPVKTDNKKKNDENAKSGKNESKKNAKKDIKTANAKKSIAKKTTDDTLENLLENTIQSDEESDDDDYEPTPAEIAEADAYVEKLLLGEQSDDDDSDQIAIYGDDDDDEDDSEVEDNDNTLTRLVNNTIDSDDDDQTDDEDFIPSKKSKAEAESKAKAHALGMAKKVAAMAKETKNGAGDEKTSAKKNQKNSTLEDLLENTIQSSDEESDDVDFEPAELDGSDDDDNQSEENVDSTLTRLIDNTINSDDDEQSEDEDYQPTKKEIAAALAKQKSRASVAGKNVVKVVKDAKKPKAIAIAHAAGNAKKNQKTAVSVIEPKPSQKRKLFSMDGSQQKQKKKKETSTGTIIVEPITPPPKVRTNFVSAPTPTPQPKKQQRKSKATVAATSTQSPPAKVKTDKKAAGVSLPTNQSTFGKKNKKAVAILAKKADVAEKTQSKKAAASVKPIAKHTKPIVVDVKAKKVTVTAAPAKAKQVKPVKKTKSK